jgi:hypothetical protein
MDNNRDKSGNFWFEGEDIVKLLAADSAVFVQIGLSHHFLKVFFLQLQMKLLRYPPQGGQ